MALLGRVIIPFEKLPENPLSNIEDSDNFNVGR